MRTVGEVLVVVGSGWFVLAAAGVLRFDDVFARMHAGTKASTAGMALVVVGSAIIVGGGVGLKLGLVVVLGFLTAPLGAHLLGRAVRHMPGDARFHLTIDEE